ncbi:ORF6C domain-containing protein [Clostridium cadaveris]|uniref:ORF6C domain-containing protein n=2 Tax=Clostridium cadaveris TaxID=1529 RepID=UPI00041EB5D3|nr:ORF6C domain-containing protein [Clostridium cadaveris]NWK10811.1 ORF6C domain-containing protein [Clostridium cadaveris]
MKNLSVITNQNQRVLTTQLLAENYETTERRISENFNANKKRYEEGKHYYCLEGEKLRAFKDQYGISVSVGERTSKLYLWTEKGALLHAKSLNTDKAWEVYDRLVETYFRVQKEMPKLSKELQAIFMLDEKTQELGDRIGKLENNMTIDYAQQEELNTLAKKVVVKTLGGVDAPAYKELNKKAFSQFWKDYKTILQVNSYKNTAVKDFVFARKVMVDWKPSRELELMIKGANSQIRM